MLRIAVVALGIVAIAIAVVAIAVVAIAIVAIAIVAIAILSHPLPANLRPPFHAQAFGMSDYDLHKYPEAFVAIQEYCMGSVVGRKVEEEHVRVKLAAKRGLRFTKPASMCARRRSEQVFELMQVPEYYQWIVNHWHAALWPELLEHLFTKEQVRADANALVCDWALVGCGSRLGIRGAARVQGSGSATFPQVQMV